MHICMVACIYDTKSCSCSHFLLLNKPLTHLFRLMESHNYGLAISVFCFPLIPKVMQSEMLLLPWCHREFWYPPPQIRAHLPTTSILLCPSPQQVLYPRLGTSATRNITKPAKVGFSAITVILWQKQGIFFPYNLYSLPKYCWANLIKRKE